MKAIHIVSYSSMSCSFMFVSFMMMFLSRHNDLQLNSLVLFVKTNLESQYKNIVMQYICWRWNIV